MLLLIYLLLSLIKYLKERRLKEQQEAQVDALSKDYERFKKMKMMELQAIER